MRFLVDAQLPPALARDIAAAGHEAVHVADIGMAAAPDRDIWKRALLDRAVLVTKDEDFVTMHAPSGAEGPPVVWVRSGSVTKRALRAQLGEILPAIVAAVERGETVIQIGGS